MEVTDIECGPEEKVVRAARNDYRSNGIIGYSVEEILESTDVDPKVQQSAEAYREEFPNDDEFDVETRNKKRSLLKHLMDSGHWGPFEHPSRTVALNGVTRVLMAQITRHRQFTFDIMSLRYVGLDDVDTGMDAPDSELTDRFQVPKGVYDGEFVSRHGVNELDDPDEVERIYLDAYANAVKRYQELMARGVPQQEARKVLPMGTKVNIVMSGNARAWMHILNVRTKSDVQGETRRAAEAIFQELKEWMPFTFEYYDNQVLPLKLNP